MRLKPKDPKLLFKRKHIKRHDVNIFVWSLKRTHREKSTRLHASVRFNGIHCMKEILEKGNFSKT